MYSKKYYRQPPPPGYGGVAFDRVRPLTESSGDTVTDNDTRARFPYEQNNGYPQSQINPSDFAPYRQSYRMARETDETNSDADFIRDDKRPFPYADYSQPPSYADYPQDERQNPSEPAGYPSKSYTLEDIVLIGILLLLAEGKADDELMLIIGLLLVAGN